MKENAEMVLARAGKPKVKVLHKQSNYAAKTWSVLDDIKMFVKTTKTSDETH